MESPGDPVRARSEYVRTRTDTSDLRPHRDARQVRHDERVALAELLLAGYRGTVDDEGEELDDALAAIDEYAGLIVEPHSVVVDGETGLVAMCFVVVFDDRYYIDPVVVHPDAKGRGLGRSVVAAVLESLAAGGVHEVGATITDGNVPSERLFASLSFDRVGAWG